MPQKTKAEIAAEKAALKESWEVVKLENEFDRAMNEGKDPNPFDVKAKKKSKGGQIKPVKAVLGVAVLGTKKGRDTLNKFFKGKKEVLSSAPGMASVPKTMNKGGGMDMGAKKPLSFKEQLAKARAEGTVEKSNTSKYLKKKSRGDKINALLKAANVPNMNKGGGMDMGQMPNTVKPRPRGNPGIVETVVGKGGDYIKDLID